MTQSEAAKVLEYTTTYEKAVENLAQVNSELYFANGESNIEFTYRIIIQYAKNSIKIVVNENNCEHLNKESVIDVLIDAIFHRKKVEIIFEDTLSLLYKELYFYTTKFDNFQIVVKNSMYRYGYIVADDKSFYHNSFGGPNICCFNDTKRAEEFNFHFNTLKKDGYTAY